MSYFVFSSLLSIRRIFFFVNIIYMNYYYYFNKKEDEKYSEIFNSINFVEGNKYFLLNQVKANSNFCRNQESIISYEYFVQCMEGDDIIIYITKNDSDNILGASSISIEHNSISIYSISTYSSYTAPSSTSGIKYTIISYIVSSNIGIYYII